MVAPVFVESEMPPPVIEPLKSLVPPFWPEIETISAGRIVDRTVIGKIDVVAGVVAGDGDILPLVAFLERAAKAVKVPVVLESAMALPVFLWSRPTRCWRRSWRSVPPLAMFTAPPVVLLIELC